MLASRDSYLMYADDEKLYKTSDLDNPRINLLCKVDGQDIGKGRVSTTHTNSTEWSCLTMDSSSKDSSKDSVAYGKQVWQRVQ